MFLTWVKLIKKEIGKICLESEKYRKEKEIKERNRVV